MSAAVGESDGRREIGPLTAVGLLGVVFGPLLTFGGYFTSDILAFAIGPAWMAWFGWVLRGYVSTDLTTQERGVH
jgi:hypothetical protein